MNLNSLRAGKGGGSSNGGGSSTAVSSAASLLLLVLLLLLLLRVLPVAGTVPTPWYTYEDVDDQFACTPSVIGMAPNSSACWEWR